MTYNQKVFEIHLKYSTLIQTLACQLSSTFMQLLFSFDRNMRVEKTRIQTRLPHIWTSINTDAKSIYRISDHVTGFHIPKFIKLRGIQYGCLKSKISFNKNLILL